MAGNSTERRGGGDLPAPPGPIFIRKEEEIREEKLLLTFGLQDVHRTSFRFHFVSSFFLLLQLFLPSPFAHLPGTILLFGRPDVYLRANGPTDVE